MITAKIIQDSTYRNRITTFELEYPRFIHAEFLTHRLFSRNSASSRAIPVAKVLEHIKNSPAAPVSWGINQPGMQASTTLQEDNLTAAKNCWQRAAFASTEYSKQLLDLNVHKQISNRVTEPYQTMKTVVTATQWDNWFELRNHIDAQPEIHELADRMQEAMSKSVPIELNVGEWHVPYVDRHYGVIMQYSVKGMSILTKEQAKIISASCCAQVSYRVNDNSLQKAYAIYDKLMNSVPRHASPVEHQATPIEELDEWAPGVTHKTRDGELWSGNFKGWIQHRQIIEGNIK